MDAEHPDDLRFLSLLAAEPGLTKEGLAAAADDRRVDNVRAARWLAGARRRGLIEIVTATDHLGRERGPRTYHLSRFGAREFNRLSADG